MLLEYKQTLPLRPNDFDGEDHIKISSLLDLFQMAAANHAEILGAGYEAMLAKNTIWVLCKIRLDVLRPIAFGSTVTVTTHPLPKGRVDYTRDYLVLDGAGNVLVTGTSQWVLVDYTTRRIVRPFVDFEGEYAAPLYEQKQASPAAVTSEKGYRRAVTFMDGDHNGHTNNSKYADMIYEGMLIQKPVKKFEIAFVKETHIGDTLELCYAESEDTLSVSGRKNGDVCFNAKLTF